MTTQKQDDKTYRKALEVLFENYGRTYQRKQIIFSEGDPGDEIFFIVSGAVNVYIGQADNYRSLWTLWAGEMFGEMALLDQLQRSASIAASLETKVVVLNRETFNQLIGKYPILAQKVIELMGKRMRKMDEQFKVESGYQKVAAPTFQPVMEPPKAAPKASGKALPKYGPKASAKSAAELAPPPKAKPLALPEGKQD